MKLYRSRTDSKMFGLCGGIARSTGVDATLVRLALVIGGFVTGGTLFFIYIVASMFVPKEPAYYAHTAPFEPAYGSGAYAGYTPAYTPAPAPRPQPSSASHIDAMMQDMEQKAMLREIQQLRSKLSQLESNQTNTQPEGDR